MAAETQKSLVRRNSGQLEIARQSSQASTEMLAQMLDLAAKMTSYELMPGEARLWNMKLVGFSADAIEWAFGEYLAQVGVDIYFPKPGQILGLCMAYNAAARQRSEEEETDRKLRENAEIRERLAAAGEPYGLAQYHSIMKRALASLVRLPPPATAKDVNRAKKKIPSPGKRGNG